MTKLFNIGTKLTINHNAERLLDDLLSTNKYVKVGILGDSDQGSIDTYKDKKKYRNSKGKIEKDSSITVGEVAYIHEFGLGNQPQRSFLRSTWEEEKRIIQRTIARLAKREAEKNSPDIDNLLRLIGVYIVGKVKRKFTKNDWPPLQDPTRGGRNKKGNATPLVDTGQLRGSVTFKVVENPRLFGRSRR